jgi:hypothetical protein
MTSRMGSMTVAGQADIRQRLNSDGLAALGLAGPLLSPVWTQAAPTADVAKMVFTVGALWYAPLAGMALTIADGEKLGLSGADGFPAEPAPNQCVILKIHPQARLRLERLMVATFQAAASQPADQSVRPVPSTILIRNPGSTFDVPWSIPPGEMFLPAGDVSFHDEHGLALDPFAFAAIVAALIQAAPTSALAAPMPGGAVAGTPATIAGLAPAGQFVHAVDLHGRPWQDPPGAQRGISLYSGSAGSRTEVDHIDDGALHAWAAGNVLSGESDVDGTQPVGTFPGLTHFGWHTLGRMGTAPLTWPAAGPGLMPVRDTLRVAVTDPVFHLLGNRTSNARDGVPEADQLTVKEQAPPVRQGSPIAFLPDGRSVLGWIGQVFLGLQGGNPAAPFTAGPIFSASVAVDNGAWSLPAAPGPAGRWPVAPAATAVLGNAATVLGQLSALRTGTTASWIAGSNDVLVQLPAGLPVGVAIRIYPIRVLMGTSPDEQPLLWRADGAATIVTGGADTMVLIDPFRLGATSVRPAEPANLHCDAVVVWQQPAVPNAPQVPQVKMIGSLAWPVGADQPRPASAPSNLLAAGFWRGIASNPMLGASPRGSFTLATVFADPIAFVQNIVRNLSTDKNPREAPRLPTQSRTESIFSLQMPPAVGGADLYRSVLTGGWLTAETDSHSYRLGNPGAAGAHEVHAPGVAATSQLGFDLWVAAAHRARPVIPTADIAAPLTSGPNAGLPTNWVLLQANATSAPPAAPAALTPSAAAVLQTVPAFVETPELALIPDDDVDAAVDWVTTKLGTWVTTPNDQEIHRQIGREVRTSKYGRRDAQWALRRAIRHARELVYIETPLFAGTAHDAGAPSDAKAAVDLVAELANRLTIEPRLRVVILVPRDIPFVAAYEPFSMFFYARRTMAAQTLAMAGGTVPGLNAQRQRVVVAHPVGVPGRPLVIRTTTVIVDDVWAMVGTSSWSRRGLTFDGANDIVMTDWSLDRGAGMSIRAHRKALMGAHLGVGPAPVGGGSPPNAVGAPAVDWTRLHQPVSAHETFADVLISGGRGKLLPLWDGPDAAAPDAVIAHPADVADPDGRGGATLVTTIAAAIGGSTVV